MIQSLHDAEEFVVMHVVKCMIKFTDMDVFEKHKVREFMRLVFPLCLHPNEWIRQSNILSAVCLGSEFMSRYRLVCDERIEKR